MNEEVAQNILETTKRDYDAIAADFSATRGRPLDALRFLFNDYLKKSDKVLDLGCGNGRFVDYFKEKKVKYLGLDNSRALVEIAKLKHPAEQFIVGDALDLPFPTSDFDVVLSLAVLHHIPSLKLRQQFFIEAARVLKPGGTLVATTWDLRPIKMLTTRNWKRLAGFLKARFSRAFKRSDLDANDFFIPWRNNQQRFVHAFSLKELERLACATGLKVVKSGIDNDKNKESNLFIVARKTKH